MPYFGIFFSILSVFTWRYFHNCRSGSKSYLIGDWKKSPSFLEVALYIKPHSLIGRSKKLKNFIEVAAYQRSFTVFTIILVQNQHPHNIHIHYHHDHNIQVEVFNIHYILVHNKTYTLHTADVWYAHIIHVHYHFLTI